MQLLEILTKRDNEIIKLSKEKEYIYNEMSTMRRLQMHLSNKLDQNESLNSLPQIPPITLAEVPILNDQENSKKISIIPHYAEKLHRDVDIQMTKSNQERFQAIKDRKKPNPEPSKNNPAVKVDAEKSEPIVLKQAANKLLKVTEGLVNENVKTPEPLNPVPTKKLLAKKKKPENIESTIDGRTEIVKTIRHQRSISTPPKTSLSSDKKAEDKEDIDISNEILRSAKIQLEFQAYVKKDLENTEQLVLNHSRSRSDVK